MSLYDIQIHSLEGKPLDLSQFKGRKLLIVNTASECGYTPQYAQLQEMHENCKDKVTVLGVPSNDFGGQEPGSPEEIADFCQARYGVTFPLTVKVKILGDDRHPLYDWLCQKSENGESDAEVAWNFNKFLIDEEGNWVKHYPSGVDPFDENLLNDLGVA
jgi:glutathione peroxidase